MKNAKKKIAYWNLVAVQLLKFLSNPFDLWYQQTCPGKDEAYKCIPASIIIEWDMKKEQND